MFRLLALGLRRSELLGPSWDSIDWRDGTVHIEQSRVLVDADALDGDQKHVAGTTTVLGVRRAMRRTGFSSRRSTRRDRGSAPFAAEAATAPWEPVRRARRRRTPL